MTDLRDPGPFQTVQDCRNFAAAVHFRHQAPGESGAAYRVALAAYVDEYHGTPTIADAIRVGAR